MCTFAGRVSEENNSRSSTSISTLGISLFIRHYLRIPIWFQILHLLICLNSAGCSAWCHVHVHHKVIGCASQCKYESPSIATTPIDAASTRPAAQSLISMNSLHKVCKHWHKHALRNAPRALLRSMVNWFTEFCNSQWLLHFAAPFINMWTKTSVAEHMLTLHQHNNDYMSNSAKLLQAWLLYHRGHSRQLSTGTKPAHQPTITLSMESHEWSFRRFTMQQSNLFTWSLNR